jgi:hypothetical protein
MHEIAVAHFLFSYFKKAKPSSEPLGPLRIVHCLEGRIRVQLPRLEKDGKSETQNALQSLSGRRGVREVSSNHRTGTLLIHYDEAWIKADEILEILEREMDM